MASSSTSQLPGRMNKRDRAKLAKDTINNLIPHILKSNTRAQKGVSSTELIIYSDAKDAPSTASAPSESPASAEAITSPPTITVIQSDTFDAAHSILKTLSKSSKSRVAVLNMASALQPGGGVLNGALAQEESLCVRSTLFPSLDASFYRLPETGALCTSDIMVFRDSDGHDLPAADRYFVDVISCAALKNPDIVKDGSGKRAYYRETDKEVMVMKIRLILQIAKQKQITHLVLGALGCGAYRNPPEEVAKIFKKVIFGDRKRAAVSGIEEIVFAIFDDGENLRVFRETFGGTEQASQT